MFCVFFSFIRGLQPNPANTNFDSHALQTRLNSPKKMECAPIQPAEVQVHNIKDQVAMCVVNLCSVRRRLSTMEADEKEYVSEISGQFLTHLVRLAHCRDADKLKDAAYSILNLFLNNIFNSESRATGLRSFRTDDAAIPQDASKSLSDSMIHTVLGSLDPAVIISNILGTGSESSDDPILTTIDGMLSVLHGFNPVKIDDFVMLCFCNEDRGCDACLGLKEAIQRKNHQRSLALFFRCIDHSRFDFGGDEEAAKVSPAFMSYANDPRSIIVPLREILLGCIDGADPQRTLSSFGNNTSYGDDDNRWTEALYRAVSATSLEDRALFTHFYAYMILSRHRRQSGDCIKQFMYTIFARFIYSATEVLFCDTENATAEIDGGKFIRYVKAMTNVSVMGSTLNTLKAFLSWRNQKNSVAPVLDIITSEWRKFYGFPAALKAVGKDMGDYVCSMAGPSRMVKQLNQSSSTLGLDSPRSVRQTEKYLPYGLLERCGTGIKLSKFGLSPAAVTKSNGRNFNCNSFHIIPEIKGCASLGTSQSSGHQSVFEKVINPGDSEKGTGRILGHITCLIDKKGLSNRAPDSNDYADFERRVNEFTRDIVFSSNLSDRELVNNGSYLPDKDRFTANSATACFDTKVHTLLLMWQRPNIAKPNLSSLTVSQLELMISKDPAKWAKFITRCFFNIERVSFQFADTIMKNMGNPENRERVGHAKGGMGVFDLFVPSHLKNADRAERLVQESIRSIYIDWTNATQDHQQPQRQHNNPYQYHQHQQQQPGVKAEFTKRLFDVLHRLIIDEDSCPSKLVAESDSLSRCIDNLDEFLMKLLV